MAVEQLAAAADEGALLAHFVAAGGFPDNGQQATGLETTRALILDPG
jgi:hypothetical protein